MRSFLGVGRPWAPGGLPPGPSGVGDWSGCLAASAHANNPWDMKQVNESRDGCVREGKMLTCPGGTRAPFLGKSAQSILPSQGDGTPPHFAPLGLLVGLSQPPLVTRSVKGKVWACLPKDSTPVPPAPAEYQACRNCSSRAGICPGWWTPPHSVAPVLLMGLEQGLLMKRSVRGKV